MQRKTVLRIMILALIIVGIIMTGGLSNQKGEESSNLSREIAKVIVEEEEKVNIIEPYIRKLAHLSEYAVRWNALFGTIFDV